MPKQFCLNCVNSSPTGAFCFIQSDNFEVIKSTECGFYQEKEYPMAKKDNNFCDLCVHYTSGKRRSKDYCAKHNVYFQTKKAIECTHFSSRTVPVLFQPKDNIIPINHKKPEYHIVLTDQYHVRMAP